MRDHAHPAQWQGLALGGALVAAEIRSVRQRLRGRVLPHPPATLTLIIDIAAHELRVAARELAIR